jgi:hypothetical protein
MLTIRGINYPTSWQELGWEDFMKIMDADFDTPIIEIITGMNYSELFGDGWEPHQIRQFEIAFGFLNLDTNASVFQGVAINPVILEGKQYTIPSLPEEIDNLPTNYYFDMIGAINLDVTHWKAADIQFRMLYDVMKNGDYDFKRSQEASINGVSVTQVYDVVNFFFKYSVPIISSSMKKSVSSRPGSTKKKSMPDL